MSHDNTERNDVTYDSELCGGAVLDLWLSPKSLTDTQIAQLALVDAALGEQARRRRQEWNEKQEDGPIGWGKPVTVKYFFRFLKYCLGPLLSTYRYKVNVLEAKVLAQEKELRETKAEIAAVKALPRGLHHVGVRERGRAYGQDMGTTHHGSTWAAQRATTSEPGTPDSGWVLIAKKGRDGRDGRDGKDARS